MRCATLLTSLFLKRKTQVWKPKLNFLESFINTAISDLSSYSTCSLRITVWESPSISTSRKPRCKPNLPNACTPLSIIDDRRVVLRCKLRSEMDGEGTNAIYQIVGILLYNFFVIFYKVLG
ncbi:hypothetical protein V6Z11_A08G123800 [Gossypium hirsutum]